MDPKTMRRFLSRYEPGPGCWEWQGKRWTNGYGVFYVDKTRTTGAHRFAWELANGPIPEGLEIDHLCKNRACVNPAHMEVVTHAENMRRARGWKKVPQATCKRGHLLSGDNVRIDPATGQRICRECQRLRMQAHRGARKQPEPRPCVVCGTVFTPDRHPKAKYCSGACRTTSFRMSAAADTPRCAGCGRHRSHLHEHEGRKLCANCLEDATNSPAPMIC